MAPEEIKAVNAVVGDSLCFTERVDLVKDGKKGEGRGAEKTKTLITIKFEKCGKLRFPDTKRQNFPVRCFIMMIVLQC